MEECEKVSEHEPPLKHDSYLSHLCFRGHNPKKL